MKDVFFLVFDLLITLAKLNRPGGSRAVIAENLLLNLGMRRTVSGASICSVANRSYWKATG